MASPSRKRVKLTHAEDHEDVSEESSEDARDEIEPSTSKPFVVASAGEAYLIGHSRKVKSSAAKLSDRVDTFTRPSYLASLDEHDAKTPSAVSEDAYDERFKLWHLELEVDFSVLLHGLGSKRQLLERFATKTLRKRGDVIIVDGFLASLSIADVLISIETDVLKGEVATMSDAKTGDKTEQRLRSICTLYAEADRRTLFVVVNNLDGIALQGAKAKAALSTLAAQPRIHLIASIDHIRAPMLFPVSVANGRRAADDETVELVRGYNFVHHHTPTLLPYTHEALLSGMPSAIFPPSIFPPLASLHSARTTSSARIHATLAVLASVNDKARRAFRHLAERTPTRYALFFSTCSGDMIASTEGQLDALLNELREHGVVVEGDTPPDAANGDAHEAANGDDEDMDDLHAVQGVKTSWIWLDLAKSELDQVLERMDG